MSQKQEVLSYCQQHGGISSLEAFRELGITRVSNRIGELQSDGFKFDRVWETSTNRHGTAVRYLRYRLANGINKGSEG